ncbi:DNA polymerase alpha/epsilon subunit B [anaerobic digester metagenome]
MTDDIILKFANADILINDTAYHKISIQKNSFEFADSLLDDLLRNQRDVFILTEDIVDKYLKNKGHVSSYGTDADINSIVNDIIVSENQDSSTAIKTPQSKLLPSVPFDFHVIKDASKKSYTSGEIKDFSAYFNSRFQKIKGILNKKVELKESYPIKDLVNMNDNVKIIGMVNDIRTTKNNHKIMELEDETGYTNVLIHNDNQKLFEATDKIVRDEVIGITGIKKGNLVIASEVIQPGVPRIEDKEMDFSTVFISDVHIGSSTFLEDAFKRFVKWMNGDFGDEEKREVANDVRYLVIAGDLVDGIGVYPNQEKELTIKDIYGQYEEAARLLGDINDVKIIIAPGNHDACRLAEPQPAIPESYAGDLYKLKNAEFVSNPSVVSLEGINTLIYHGRSFDDMVMTVNGMSHQHTDVVMKELLEKRHLAPIYGERTPLASEFEDHLVIEEIPDIFHTGHVHINAYKRYKGIHIINSGTFQSQTEFQKIYNIVPTCAEVPVLNRGSMKIFKFN